VQSVAPAAGAEPGTSWLGSPAVCRTNRTQSGQPVSDSSLD
jgi:hypothetical protein